MKTIQEMMSEKVLLLDGAMGTQIFARKPTVDDYGGADLEGCVELFNVTRKNWIQEIHASYFDAGADVVETNTFGCNRIVLSEFGIPERALELNIAAVQLAKEVARQYKTPKFVVGSVGPGTKLLTLLQVDYKSLYESYYEQMKGLLLGGADAILIETSQDLGQIKASVRAAKHAMLETGIQCPIWTQVTIETTGTMLVGSDIQAALATIEMLGVQVMGMNCAMGPDEMRQHIAYLSEAAPMALSCLPNAGLPLNVGGETVYPLGPKEFSNKVLQIAQDFGLSIIGGCCGTTPEHILELSRVVGALNPGNPKGKYERSVSSLYSSVSLNLEPRPLFVGERTNANGSKKFKDLLAAEDWDGMVSVARGQLKEGAHVLDVCVAYVGRDEIRDMEEFLKRVVTQVNIPLMIDSTEVPVIERALQLSPGKCIVNSINFEDGEERARKILGLCKEYGAAVVALTIDETGMAKSLEHKKQVVDRLVKLAVEDFGLHPSDLIIDPLTFTLGSGDEEFRKSAVSTLEGIAYVKQRYPLVKTILGLSNVSFGLNPYPRQILNSMMLYHAVKSGLDMAILNASKILPVAKIEQEDRKMYEDLIFDKRSENYDPLKTILAKFTSIKGKGISAAESAALRKEMPVEERLKVDIIDGEKQFIVEDAKEALQKHPPLHIINNILLEGMKVVGERFGAGEMQLPFVLESAEAMKAAVRTLEPFMEKKEGYAKGTMLLATVKGDVHDIGKNLVEIILSNNGYQVINLGIKQPIESVLERYKETPTDAIGLSGLLVKSTVIMKENLQYMAGLGYTVPVVLGGAALTRSFVEEDCQAVYKGPVFYASDAFEGLKLMEVIADCKEKNVPLDVAHARKFARASGQKSKIAPTGEDSSLEEGRLQLDGHQLNDTDAAAENLDGTGSAQRSKIKVVRKGGNKIPLDTRAQSSWIRKDYEVPIAPFWGTKVIQDTVATVFDFLDDFALVRARWGFQKGGQSDEDLRAILENKALPLLKHWKAKIIDENLLIPKAIYGYFPTQSEGNVVRVYKVIALLASRR